MSKDFYPSSGNNVGQVVVGLDPTSGLTMPPNGCYNGSTFDALYNNVQGVLAPSAARTATPAIATQTNPNHRGVMLFLNVTASPAVNTSTLTLAVQAIEPVTGTALYTIAQPAVITATAVANAVAGLYVLEVYPGLASVTTMTKSGAAATYNNSVPRVWTAAVTHNDANSWTYSLAYALMV